MPICAEAYRCAVGCFSSVFINLLMKKQRKTMKTKTETSDNVCSGMDIAVFFYWLVLVALLSYAFPFCIHFIFCTDWIVTSSTRNIAICSPMETPYLSFALLCCGDIHPHPGPGMEQGDIHNSNMEKRLSLLEGKINELLEITKTSKIHFESRFASLENECRNQTQQFSQQFSKLEKRLVEMETSWRMKENEIDTVQNEFQNVNDRLQNLETLAEKHERYSRKAHILLHGLKEQADESLVNPSKVLEIFRTYFPNKEWSLPDIESAYRLGSRSNSSTRPILVKFHRWCDALCVMRDKTGKEKMREQEGVRVSADLTISQRDTLSYYKRQGKIAYYYRGKLFVKDPVFDSSRPNPRRDARCMDVPIVTSDRPLSAIGATVATESATKDSIYRQQADSKAQSSRPELDVDVRMRSTLDDFSSEHGDLGSSSLDTTDHNIQEMTTSTLSHDAQMFPSPSSQHTEVSSFDQNLVEASGDTLNRRSRGSSSENQKRSQQTRLSPFITGNQSSRTSSTRNTRRGGSRKEVSDNRR